MINLMKSTFYHEEDTKRKLCDFIMSSDKLSMGDVCFEFEKKFSKYQKREYSVLFNSGSSANLALLHALVNLNFLKRKNKIGFSSLTWATNPMPILQLDLIPIPVDVSIKTLNSSSENLLDVLEKTNLNAFFITNLLGFCDDLEKIKKICEKKKIILIEDNCESLGSKLKNTLLGNFGLASTFSFFVGHHMSTIEGGMVCTDDKSLFDMLKMVRAHGWSRNLDIKKQKELKKKNKINAFYDNYTFYVSGYNFRPTEITGFLGLNQLQYLEEIHKKRQSNFLRFKKIADKNPDIEKLDVSHMSFVSNFAYPVVFKTKDLFERYKKRFLDNNIEIRPIVGGSMIEQPFFQEYTKNNKIESLCSISKKIHKQGFYFPNHPELTDKEVMILSKLLKK